jgi:hypothetical protein
LTNDVDTIPREVLFPPMATWVEKLGYLVCNGINAGQISVFMQIAVDAGEGKIANIITTVVLLGNDVLNVKGGKGRVVLMQLTVFATIASALANENSRRFLHHL